MYGQVKANNMLYSIELTLIAAMWPNSRTVRCGTHVTAGGVLDL